MGGLISSAGRFRNAAILICLGVAGLSILLHYQAPEETIPPSGAASLSEEQEIPIDGLPPASAEKASPPGNETMVPKVTSASGLPGKGLPAPAEADKGPQLTLLPQTRACKRPPVGWPVLALLTEIDSFKPDGPTALPPPRLPEAAPPMLIEAAGEQSAEDPIQIPLDRPLESSPQPGPPSPAVGPVTEALPALDAPLGFTGRSSVAPRDALEDPHFVPVEDRWRIGFPAWDRYDKGHPPVNDYPYVEGHWWDPFNQNVLKGDYPIIGQNIFLTVTAFTQAVVEPREIPTATTPFEVTLRPNSEQFFGRPNQLGYLQNFGMSLDLFRGDGAFRPDDWRVKLTPIFNVNVLSTQNWRSSIPM